MAITEYKKTHRHLAWRIVRASANDNRTSLSFWLRHFLPWGALIGLLLAWFLFVH